MKSPDKSGGFKLSRNWPIEEVETALRRGESAKLDLVKFISERYKERFFEPIQILQCQSKLRQKKEANGTSGSGEDFWHFGFAIMALCCLLVETFQCYRAGLPSSHPPELKSLLREYSEVDEQFRLDEEKFPKKGEEIYQCFFDSSREIFDGVDGKQFYRCIRNGILHQAQTKNGWTINVGRTKLWDADNKSLSRDVFVKKLRVYFNEYLAELHNAGWETPVWAMARRKIFWLCELSKT